MGAVLPNDYRMHLKIIRKPLHVYLVTQLVRDRTHRKSTWLIIIQQRSYCTGQQNGGHQELFSPEFMLFWLPVLLLSLPWRQTLPSPCGKLTAESSVLWRKSLRRAFVSMACLSNEFERSTSTISDNAQLLTECSIWSWALLSFGDIWYLKLRKLLFVEFDVWLTLSHDTECPECLVNPFSLFCCKTLFCEQLDILLLSWLPLEAVEWFLRLDEWKWCDLIEDIAWR